MHQPDAVSARAAQAQFRPEVRQALAASGQPPEESTAGVEVATKSVNR